MQSGQLRPGSRIRPDRLMTLNETIFQRTIGRLTAAKQAEIAAAMRSLF
jgi:mRNA-degrading endonuclease toxin of MazEF toxin-antitoxin module